MRRFGAGLQYHEHSYIGLRFSGEVKILETKEPQEGRGWARAGDIDLGAITAIMLRRKWVIGILAMIVFVLGGLATLRSPKVYEATTTIEIESSVASVLGRQVQDVYHLGAQGYYDTRAYYETQYKTITSRPVARKTAEILGLAPDKLMAAIEAVALPKASSDGNVITQLPEALQNKLAFLGLKEVESKEKLLESLSEASPSHSILGSVTVEPVKRSKLVLIHVEDTDPDRASELANALVQAYMAVNLDKKIAATQSAVQWLADQVMQTKTKLENSEQALHDFKRVNSIVSVSLEDKLSMSSQTLSSLNASLSQVRATRLGLEAKRATLAGTPTVKRSNSIKSVVSNGLIQRLKQSLSEVKQRQMELLDRYTAEHPKALSLAKQVKLLEVSIANETNEIVNVVEQEYQTLVSTERRLKAAIAEVKAEALDLSKWEIEYKRLTREAANHLALHNVVLTRHKEAKLTQMLRVNNIHLVEPALVPLSPIKPRVSRRLMIFLILGFICGVCGAVVAEFIDNSVKHQDHVEQDLGLSFLGILPAIEEENQEAAKTESTIDPTQRDRVVLLKPKSSLAECARTIRTNLLFMSPETPTQTLVVTSNGPREGKSTTVICLAATMAQSGARTLIVDTDMRRPRLHKSFGVANVKGLTNLIVGDAADEAAIVNCEEKLDLLPCGPIPPNPAELLHSTGFHNLVERLKGKYDRIIFDSPPVSPVTDATIMATIMDGVVFVVQANKTNLPGAKASLARLRNVGANMMGGILNDVNIDAKHSGQYYYYYKTGYYYGDDSSQNAA